MDLVDLAEKVESFVLEHGGYWDLEWMLAALTEELGELSREIQNYAGLRNNEPEKENLDSLNYIEEECGDLLFALLCLTNLLNLDLEKALLNTLNKYKQRESGL